MFWRISDSRDSTCLSLSSSSADGPSDCTCKHLSVSHNERFSFVKYIALAFGCWPNVRAGSVRGNVSMKSLYDCSDPFSGTQTLGDDSLSRIQLQYEIQLVVRWTIVIIMTSRVYVLVKRCWDCVVIEVLVRVSFQKSSVPNVGHMTAVTNVPYHIFQRGPRGIFVFVEIDGQNVFWCLRSTETSKHKFRACTTRIVMNLLKLSWISKLYWYYRVFQRYPVCQYLSSDVSEPLLCVTDIGRGERWRRSNVNCAFLKTEPPQRFRNVRRQILTWISLKNPIILITQIVLRACDVRTFLFTLFYTCDERTIIEKKFYLKIGIAEFVRLVPSEVLEFVSFDQYTMEKTQVEQYLFVLVAGRFVLSELSFVDISIQMR